MFPKQKRIKNQDLIKVVQQKGCLICGQSPNDAHHVTSKGAGGGDTECNLMPLCRWHHSKIHSQGIYLFMLTHEIVEQWLKKKKRTDVLGYEPHEH